MNGDYNIFWGETHHNSYMHYMQRPPLAEVMGSASAYLDFYAGAYYTAACREAAPLKGIAGPPRRPKGGHPCEETAPAAPEWKGVMLEGFKDPELMKREWAEFQEVTAAWNRPGEFVAFPGYEWQGDGRWGDHNVIYKNEGNPVFTADTLAELYECLRGIEAIAVPHHTAYYVGQRAPVWSACDDCLSPFTELFSLHGCSETDEELIGLRRNSHMGPGVGGGTYQDALDAGLHLGAICSTDNWSNMPGRWGQGLMGCVAKELTRESLWEAFRARRVFGVTGDRIQVEFSVNDRCMGDILDYVPKRNLHVSVRGLDALDRIEILRNGRVIATHCHQGTWSPPPHGAKTRFKLRIEPGWGPRPGELPLPDRRWEGELSVAGGRIIGWEPCWITPGQHPPRLSGGTARFVMISRQSCVPMETQGATVFEFEADPEAQLTVRLNGVEVCDAVETFAARSRLLWFRDECVQLVRETTGLEPRDAEREDIYYHVACKAKLHRAIPEAGYTAEYEITDDEPLERETNYRVRIEQRNGQRAWSSPIWVRAER